MLTALVVGLDSTGAGVIFEADHEATMSIFQAGGWTLLTAINLMVFSLIHNPCSTTIYTIYKETGSRKWTVVAALLPLLMGILITFTIAQIWRFLAS
jgi:ferrous iron transport protein B